MSKPIVKFSVSKVDSRHYEAKAVVPCKNGYSFCIVAKTRCQTKALSKLLAMLRNNLQNRLFTENKLDHNVPKSGIRFVFDGNLSNCPDFCEPEKQKPVIKSVTQEDLALYEVRQCNGSWTIVKHQTPLLSKKEATDLLFSKIGG